MYTLIHFYRFFPVSDPEVLRSELQQLADSQNLIGTVLVAAEGVNGGLAGSKQGIDEFIAASRRIPGFETMEYKLSSGETKPYAKLRIKIKNWIVRFVDDADPSVDEILGGKRVSPDEFRRIVESQDEDYTIVDTRNYYETDYGVFQGAERLRIDNFRQFPAAFLEKFHDQKDRKFVIYCTGGIRCEKAAPYLEKQGFKNVFQVDGGMTGYFDKHGSAGFDGQCFVFDRRWVITPELKEGSDGDDLNLRIQPKRREWPQSQA